MSNNTIQTVRTILPTGFNYNRRIMIHQLQDKYGYFFAKRCTDLALSALLMLLLYPWLMPILMILIKFESKGPLFFRQKRTGYLGRTFYCTKLRTMVVNDLADIQQATEDDPRITRIGRFLRKTGLDELPQLINVVKGEMSIIGPRPHMLNDTAHFSSVVKNYNTRHLVRPGITGIAQIMGYRGYSEDLESIYRRYQWDLYYVRNTGWLLDTKIFWGTVALTFQHIIKRGRHTDAKQSPPRVIPIGQTREVNEN